MTGLKSAKTKEGARWHGIFCKQGDWFLCAPEVQTEQTEVSLSLLDEYKTINNKKAAWDDDKHLFNYTFRERFGVKGEEPGAFCVVETDELGRDRFRTLVDPSPEEQARAKWFSNQEILDIIEIEASFKCLQQKLSELPKYPWQERAEPKPSTSRR